MTALPLLVIVSIAIDHRVCPSCPAVLAARELFCSQDVLTRLAGSVGPFVVTAILAGLLVARVPWLGARTEKPSSWPEEEEAHDAPR
jgi:hypothetical protein